MAAKSSILDIDAQIEKLRERHKTLIVKSAERFARAATKAGLAEMEIADEEVDRIFEEIAAGASPRGQPGGGTGAATEVSHDS
ncbi:MAG: TraC family protein [Rhizobiales bacterium]|nr:TraC family protein [Hyphomicrobiales bacterium]